MCLIARTERNLSTIPGYTRISDYERTLLKAFALAWPLFEERCLGREGSLETIRDFARTFAASGDVGHEIRAAFDYFKNRYTVGPAHTRRFHSLCYGREDDPENQRSRGVKEAIEAGFANDDPTPTTIVQTVALVVFRLRNNLLHGSKFDNVAGQRNNIEHSLRVLNRFVEMQHA